MTTKNHSDRWLVNLSKAELTEQEKSVLVKGLNFAPTQTKVPKAEYIASAESALLGLKDIEGANNARVKVSALLKSVRRPESNLSARDRRTLKELDQRENIVIAPADKGSIVVVLDADDYDKKVRDLIDHPPFQKVKKDPTKLVEGKLNKYLFKLHQEGTIDRDLYNTLRSSSCPLPRFYGRVKIHKPSKPVRPVISAVGTALYPVSKYLARVKEN